MPQWYVTPYGIECWKPVRYHVKADVLATIKDRDGGTYYDWPLHMAEKEWVSLSDFESAFRKALRVHQKKTGPSPSEGLLRASFDKARRRGRP